MNKTSTENFLFNFILLQQKAVRWKQIMLCECVVCKVFLNDIIIVILKSLYNNKIKFNSIKIICIKML